MAGILFDTSVYIVFLRSRDWERLPDLEKLESSQRIWLSAVVLEELYAGSKKNDWKQLGRFCNRFAGVERILLPNISDWIKAGEILALIGDKYGYENIGRSRLTNDALIAASAFRNGIKLITLKQRDFAKICEFCPFAWRTIYS